MKDPQLAALELAAQQRYAKSGATPASTLLAKVNAAPKQVAQDIAAKTANPMYQQWRPEFVPTPSQAAPVSSIPPTNVAPVVQTAPKKNIIQSIADPLTDLLATGYRTGEGVVRGAQAIGQSAMGDKEAAAETMRKINENIYKPVNIPLLGQGDVRRIGTVTESGAIAPSKETLKSLGTAAELASFATPVKGSGAIGNQVFKQTGKAGLAKAAGTLAKYTLPSAMGGALAGGGSKLAETGDLGQAGKSALGGALIGGAIGTVLPKALGAISKKTTQVPKGIAQQKALDEYASAIGLNKSTYKQQAKDVAKLVRFGTKPKDTLKTLLEDGVILKAKNEGGRAIFDTTDNIAEGAAKMIGLEDQLDNLLASDSRRLFNLDHLAKQAKRAIESNDRIDATTAKKMLNSIDELMIDTKARYGKTALPASVVNNLKRSVYDRSRYESQSAQNVEHWRELGRVFKEAIENRFKDRADVSGINKQIGRMIDQEKLLIDINGKVVQGGRLPKLASRGLGALAGAAIPLPLPGLKEYVGSEIGGKFHDFITDPSRLTGKAVKAFQEAGEKVKPGAIGQALGKVSDKIPDFNVGAVAALGADSFGGSPEAQSVPQETPQPQTGKYTPAQIGQRMKAKHPELANFSDEEIGSRMIAKHPELAQLAQ